MPKQRVGVLMGQQAQLGLDWGDVRVYAECECFAMFVAENRQEAVRGQYEQIYRHSRSCDARGRPKVWLNDFGGGFSEVMLVKLAKAEKTRSGEANVRPGGQKGVQK